MDLQAVLDQYIETALWSSTDGEGQQLDAIFDADAVDPKTKQQMLKDISKFLTQNKALIEEAGLDASDVGHDFWLSRNGHGAGFFDRGLGPVGDRLQKAAKRFGEYDLYVGDDGYLHGSGGASEPASHNIASLADKFEAVADRIEKARY